MESADELLVTTQRKIKKLKKRNKILKQKIKELKWQNQNIKMEIIDLIEDNMDKI